MRPAIALVCVIGHFNNFCLKTIQPADFFDKGGNGSGYLFGAYRYGLTFGMIHNDQHDVRQTFALFRL